MLVWCGFAGRSADCYSSRFTLGTLSAKIFFVNLQAILLHSSFSVVPVAATHATGLPDACGNQKVRFEISLQKKPPAPAKSAR